MSKLVWRRTLTLFLFIIKRFPIISSLNSSLNNTAFLFLHNKLIGQSKKFIYNKIERSGATAFELSNLALTEYYISNELGKAESLLKMANYISISKQQKFVIAFNSFIIYSLNKNYIKAKENIEICYNLRPKEFKKYNEFSLIVQGIRQSEPIIDDYLNKLKYV